MKNNNRFDGLLGEVASELLWMGMGVLLLWILFSWWWLIQDVRYQWSLERFDRPGLVVANEIAPTGQPQGAAPTPGYGMKGVL